MAGSEPILQVRHRDGRFGEDDQRPFSVLNGIAEPIPGQSIDGPAVGVADSTSRRRASLNRAVEFEGETYWWHRNSIRVSVPGSGWTRGEAPAGGRGVQTLSFDTDYAWANIGLFPIVNRDGHQELVAAYSDRDDLGWIGLMRKQSKITGDGTWGAEQIVDLDNNRDIASYLKVRSVPMLCNYVSNEPMDSVIGANEEKIAHFFNNFTIIFIKIIRF